MPTLYQPPTVPRSFRHGQKGFSCGAPGQLLAIRSTATRGEANHGPRLLAEDPAEVEKTTYPSVFIRNWFWISQMIQKSIHETNLDFYVRLQKWTNVTWKRALSKGKFIFQAWIFRWIAVSFQGVYISICLWLGPEILVEKPKKPRKSVVYGVNWMDYGRQYLGLIENPSTNRPDRRSPRICGEVIKGLVLLWEYFGGVEIRRFRLVGCKSSIWVAFFSLKTRLDGVLPGGMKKSHHKFNCHVKRCIGCFFWTGPYQPVISRGWKNSADFGVKPETHFFSVSLKGPF